MEVQIQDIAQMRISGVSVQGYPAQNEYAEAYFRWVPYNLKTGFQNPAAVSGCLTGWHHAPVFTQVETHADDEMFFFTQGSCIMIFCDLKDGSPDMDSVQLARIPAGTQLIIQAGKAHFVPVAEGDCFEAILYAPEQDSPRVSLPEMVEGIA